MPLLSQVIGHASDSKKVLKATLTGVYQKLQKASVYTGLTRTYQPLTEEGAQFPPESNLVQTTVTKELLSIMHPLNAYINDSISLNQGNTEVLVDVVVQGEIMFSKVPPTFLMELKKQVADIYTLVSKLPTLDPSTQWDFNPNSEVYVSPPMTTYKTQKTKRMMTLAPATDKHPAQVTTWDEDVAVGTWSKVDQSGAIPLPLKNKLVSNVEALEKAIGDALAEANAHKVKDLGGRQKVVDYLFKDILTA
ncbi:hypothetical protein [Microcoleus phage My-WqHQDG]|nr:hypothetical protein [Microcoleus phage My-WqHQDG]